MNSKKNATSVSALEEVRSMIARARQGTLASLMAGSGQPYASLVKVASLEGEPLLLLSELAWHTKNILADARACLLISAETGSAEAGSAETGNHDPLSQPRASLIGQIAASEDERAREIYLSLHPNARSYADLTDFRYFKLNVETVHYVAGFGQIVTIERPQLAAASR